MTPARISHLLPTPVRAAFIGAGGMARHHLRAILADPHAHTEIVALVEPAPASYEAAAALFVEAGRAAPRHLTTLEALLRGDAGPVDAVFIITPHVCHHEQAVACLETGIDVLLEKPMVMNAAEARSLIATQERTGRLLVVAFNGSLSPQVRAASRMLRAGELGPILAINAVVWQAWRFHTTHTWRQDPAISGGGFLFDTGAHMLNTVVDLAGEPVVEVSAHLDNRSAPVDITAAVLARLESGALVSLCASGETMPERSTIGSEVHVLCTQGIVRTGIWGERLLVQRPGQDRLRSVRVAASRGAWDQFLRVRTGAMTNPCPPEVGLRMALLWDAIQASAAEGGAPVRVAPNAVGRGSNHTSAVVGMLVQSAHE